MRGVRVCFCGMYQPINFLLWPLQVTVSLWGEFEGPLDRHCQSRSGDRSATKGALPSTNCRHVSGLFWWGVVYPCAGSWKAISLNADCFWYWGYPPWGSESFWSFRWHHVPTHHLWWNVHWQDAAYPLWQLRGGIWFHLGNAFRNETPEIPLILVMHLIDLGCGSAEAACTLEQQTEQLDAWIQLLSLPHILSADADTVPMSFWVCSCNCDVVKLFFSPWKNITQFWGSSSKRCSFKGRVLSRSLVQKLPRGGGKMQSSSGGCWAAIVWPWAEAWVASELLSFSRR